MLIRLSALAAWVAVLSSAADWNAQLAAEYLDGRQKEWFAWPRAAARGGPCLSCHTGVAYLLARPALSKALGQAAPATYESGLLGGIRTRTEDHEAPATAAMPGTAAMTKAPLGAQLTGTQAVLAPFVLVADDVQRGHGLSAATETALRRMWAAQIRTGTDRGTWLWTSLDLEPWEGRDSSFFGAALAAIATGMAPGGYQSRDEIRENLDTLKSYLKDRQAGQPLHNRLMYLWASTRLRGLASETEAQAIISEAWRRQSDDGGWSLEAIGPWRQRAEAPLSRGSNSYATGLAAFALQRAGARKSDPRLGRALEWLKAHQDPKSGSWEAMSMNKRYEAGSMQERFMRDAATGLAVLALLPGE